MREGPGISPGDRFPGRRNTQGRAPRWEYPWQVGETARRSGGWRWKAGGSGLEDQVRSNGVRSCQVMEVSGFQSAEMRREVMYCLERKNATM